MRATALPQAVLTQAAQPRAKVWRAVLLNRNHSGWEVPEVSEDDCYSIRENYGKEAYAQVIKGDFNDDWLQDYAVLIQHNVDANDKGVAKPFLIQIAAFFSKGDGYKMHDVTARGGSCLMLMRKGETDYHYESQSIRAIRFSRGLGGMSYVVRIWEISSYHH